MDKRIGAQYYTIRDYCQNLEDFDGACKRIREIGYKTIQLSGTGNFEANEIKPIVDKYGLEVVCTHRPPKNYLEEIEKEIEFHKTLGCKICGLGMIPGGSAKEELIEAFIHNFKPVCKKLEENGLTFTYHNHAFEFQKINGKYAFDIITEGMDVENFKYLIDVYWIAVAGISPSKFIREHKGKIKCVHFKDLIVRGKEARYAELGVGNLDWDDIIAACEESDVEYAFVEQDICETNPFDCLKTSYDFIKTKGFY